MAPNTATPTSETDLDLSAAIQNATTAMTDLVATVAALHTPNPEAVVAIEGVGRRADAARVLAAATLSDKYDTDELGFASPTSAIATLAQVTEKTARDRLVVAGGITPDLSITGCGVPAAHPVLAAAVTAGTVGLDAAALITRELDSVKHRVDADALAAAETMMVNLASGWDATGEHRVSRPGFNGGS